VLRNVHPASSEIGTRLFLEEKATAGVKLTAHVYAVPSLRISGAVSCTPYTPSWRGHGQLYLLLYRVWCVDDGPRSRASAAWTARTVRVPPATTEPLTVAQQLIPKIAKIGQWACTVRMEIHLPVSGHVWLSVSGPSGVTTLTLAGQLFVKNPLSNFVKIRQTGYSLLPGNGQADGWMDVVWMQGVLLGRVHKISKSDYTSSCLSVCPSVCMEQLCFHCTDFHEIWFEFLRKSVDKIHCIKIWQE